MAAPLGTCSDSRGARSSAATSGDGGRGGALGIGSSAEGLSDVSSDRAPAVVVVVAVVAVADGIVLGSSEGAKSLRQMGQELDTYLPCLDACK